MSSAGDQLYFGEAHVDANLGRSLADAYHIERPLGRGGASVVYAGREIETDRLVAIKILRARSFEVPRVLPRLRYESRLLALLDHPHAIASLGSGCEEDGTLYLIEELAKGETLAATLHGHSRGLGEATALDIVDQIADVLERAHQLGIIHGDLKPSNIMIYRGLVKVGFGFARLAVDPATGVMGDDPEAPVLYKPVYAAPEQIGGIATDRRADVYSLGVVLHHCLAGRPPFVGDVAALHHSHLFEEPPPIRSAAGALVRVMLSKDRNERVPTMLEVRRCISRLRREVGITKVSRPEPEDSTPTRIVNMPVYGIDDDS